MSATDTDLAEGPLDIRFSSHATIDTLDSEKSRKFYEEFLGFEVIRTSPISLLLRLGGSHTIACRSGGDAAKHFHSPGFLPCE